MGSLFISPDDLIHLLRMGHAPLLFDVRRKPAFDAGDRLLPGARWHPHDAVETWIGEVSSGTPLVAYCAHGHNVSQMAVAALRALGKSARTLSGGIEAWIAAGYPTVGKCELAPADAQVPSRWVTRTNPKIDRIACPWLIRRFIDPTAEILFVEPAWVLDVAAESGAVAFDIPGAPIEHEGERCSFDTLIDRFGIDDPSLHRLALIVRGADTARPDLAPEAAGLLAVSLGVSAMSFSDEDALERGFRIYDALYAWLTLASEERHNWPRVDGDNA